MALIKFENFSFRYPNQKYSLSNINLEISSGEFVLLCGPSGSGKTTLLANIKKEITPAGDCKGNIYYNDLNLNDLDEKKSASEIGFLFQNPEDQFVSDNVLQEIAFSVENMGLTTNEIRNRVAEMTAFFGLDKYLYKKVDELSGGQKQLVNLCSLLVLKPKLLLLDEPTSQLDPIAAYDFLSILRRLNEEFSITIIVTEHKIDNIFPFIDKAIFLEDGSIKYEDEPRGICLQAWKNKVFQNYLPMVTRIHFLLQSKHNFLDELKIPLNIREARTNLDLLDEELMKTSQLTLLNKDYNNIKRHTKLPNNSSPELIKCNNIWFGYERDHIVLKGIFISIKQGEFVSLLGGNGTGKTTFLQIISGLIKPIKGKITYKNNITLGYVHQNPMIHFQNETVDEELNGSNVCSVNNPMNESKHWFKKFFGTVFESDTHIDSRSNHVSNHEKEEIIKFFGLSDLLNKHPYDCSGGEQQKIAIAKALLTNPDVLILDEPTKGIDPVHKIHLANKLKKLQEKGLTIVMATHDIDFAAEYTERCILLFDGGIQIDDAPRSIFSNNNFYTTFVNRMVKDYLPYGVTLNDVREKWRI